MVMGEGAGGVFDKLTRWVFGPKEIVLGEMSQFEVKPGEAWVLGDNPRQSEAISLKLFTNVGIVGGLELPMAVLSIRLDKNGNPVIRSCTRQYAGSYRSHEIAIWHKLPRTRERYWDEWTRKLIVPMYGLTEKEIADAGENQIVEVITKTAAGIEPVTLRTKEPIIHTMVLRNLGSVAGSASQDRGGIRWRVEIDPKEVDPNRR